MANCFVIGSAGFIGAHYIKYFEMNHLDFQLVHFDIADNPQQDVRKPISINCEKISSEDLIINLAAIHRMPGHDDYEYFETNIKGAENVCAFAEEKGINNIIFTSSIAPYGAGEDVKCESTLPLPNTPYGISKLIAEHIHRTWQAKEPAKRKLLILRPGVVYGKGENGNNTRLYNALKSGWFFYPGRRNTIKANVYVKDLVQLSLQIFKSYSSGTRLYNFAYEPSYRIDQIVNTICEVTSIRKPSLVINGRLLKTVAKILNIISIGKIGIHPKRVEKLMKSTNISGKKIIEDGFSFEYDLKTSVEDWYKDCNSEGLF